MTTILKPALKKIYATTKAGKQVDLQILNGFLESSMNSVEWNPRTAGKKFDQVNDYMRSQIGGPPDPRVNIHPVDRAYSDIEEAIKETQTRKKILNADPVNEILAGVHDTPAIDMEAANMLVEMHSNIDKIFTWYLPKQESDINFDEVNNLVEKIYGSDRYKSNPTHSRESFHALLNASFGPVKIINTSLDDQIEEQGTSSSMVSKTLETQELSAVSEDPGKVILAELENLKMKMESSPVRKKKGTDLLSLGKDLLRSIVKKEVAPGAWKDYGIKD